MLDIPGGLVPDLLEFYRQCSCTSFAEYVKGLQDEHLKIEVKRPDYGKFLSNTVLIEQQLTKGNEIVAEVKDTAE